MTALKTSPRIEAERGGWLTLHWPAPELDQMSANELLQRTEALSSWLRYTRTPEGKVELLGEVLLDASEGGVEQARERLRGSLQAPQGPAPSDEALETVLDGVGLPWKRRGSSWTVSPEGEAYQVLLTLLPGGVRAEALLAEWDEIGEIEQRALAHYLSAAQAGLRCARCELTAHQARVVTQIEAGRLEEDLAHGLRGLTMGCHILWRSVRALLDPALARRYLTFHQPGPEEVV